MPSALEQFGQDLSSALSGAAEHGRLVRLSDPYQALITSFLQYPGQMPLLIGYSVEAMKAVVLEFAGEIAHRPRYFPARLHGCRIFSVDAGSLPLRPGDSYPEALYRISREASATNGRAALFLENLERAFEAADDALDILKSAVQKEGLRCIGAAKKGEPPTERMVSKFPTLFDVIHMDPASDRAVPSA